MKIAAPEDRGPLASESVSLVRRHSPVGDHDARGRRCTAEGTPPRLESLAVFEPLNVWDGILVGHSCLQRIAGAAGNLPERLLHHGLLPFSWQPQGSWSHNRHMQGLTSDIHSLAVKMHRLQHWLDG